jgi:hypothetical protein
MSQATIEATTSSPANAPQGGSLIPICDHGVELRAAAYRAWDAADDLTPCLSPERFRLEHQGKHMFGQAEALAGVAADMPAACMAELLAKARLVAALASAAEVDSAALLAASLARDLIALHG